PGMHDAVVAVATGYGRDKQVGRASADLGKNVYPLVSFNGETFSYTHACTVEKTEEFYPIAITQTHHSYEDRPILKEYTIEEFKKDPRHLINERKKELAHYTHLHWEGHHEEEIGRASCRERV